jgi:hypothetical protein
VAGLGVKGSQVQILSSRQPTGRYPMRRDAALSRLLTAETRIRTIFNGHGIDLRLIMLCQHRLTSWSKSGALGFDHAKWGQRLLQNFGSV